MLCPLSVIFPQVSAWVPAYECVHAFITTMHELVEGEDSVMVSDALMSEDEAETEGAD